MTATVTVESTDFIPLINSHKYIFIFFCKTASGKMCNVEEINTKTKLCNKYGIGNPNFDEWDETMFAGKVARVKRNWRGRRMLKEFVHSAS